MDNKEKHLTTHQNFSFVESLTYKHLHIVFNIVYVKIVKMHFCVVHQSFINPRCSLCGS